MERIFHSCREQVQKFALVVVLHGIQFLGHNDIIVLNTTVQEQTYSCDYIHS
jgi:hypothetical protein